MDLSPIYGLGYLHVRSDKQSAWSQMAAEVAGMMVDRDGDLLRLRMDERVARIIVEPKDVDSPGDDDAVIGWECRSREAWESVRELVEKAGLGVTDHGSSPWAKDSFRCPDPSGLPCEFFYGGRTEPIRHFVSPTGATFVTGDQAMGHITVFANRLQESTEFYEHVLGFHLRETIDTNIQAAFLSPNPREHSLALLGTSGESSINHVMIEVTELNTVGRAMDRCYEGAAPMTLSIGRHWNDHMTSFYFRTPSGFEIEYGFGGRQISAEGWSRIEQGGVGGSSYWGHRVVRPDGTLGHQIGQ